MSPLRSVLAGVALHPPVLVGPFQSGAQADTPAAQLWERLAGNDLPLTTLPHALGADWPYAQALLAEDPPPHALGMDVKQRRATEHSMRLGVAAARRAAAAPWHGPAPSAERTGLYLGLPSIEDAAPSWDVLEDFSASGEAAARLGHYALHTSQPMVGLTRLNSTLLAHLSISLRLGGAHAGFSPFADAGVQALIEAVLSVAEGDNDAALAGGTSAHLNETAALQWKALGLSRFGVLAGEGAGVLKVERCPGPRPGALRVRGFGRCFHPQGPAQALAAAVRSASAMAGEAPGWVVTDLALADAPAPQLPLARRAGWLGGAHGATALALAALGLRRQARLVADTAQCWRIEAAPLACAAIAGCGPHGQAAAVIVGMDPGEGEG